MRSKLVSKSVLLACTFALATLGRPAAAATFDETIPPGANYDKAEFRLWLPDAPGPVRAIVLLVPGSNGDGRPMADDPVWQSFATKHHLALVACHLTDKPHDQMFIEHYIDVSKGTGQALFDALSSFASKSSHPELASAPMMLWGMSAGGEFNYEMAAWKPERVIAFVVNKGNVYYSALVSDAARNTPGILFTGEKDMAFRINAIDGLFAINRRAGALWALAQEPGIGHAVGESRDFALVFFEEMMKARLPESAGGEGPVTLRAVDAKSGFYGDQKTHALTPIGDKAPGEPMSWLPNERVAHAWQAVVEAKPVQ